MRSRKLTLDIVLIGGLFCVAAGLGIVYLSNQNHADVNAELTSDEATNKEKSVSAGDTGELDTFKRYQETLPESSGEVSVVAVGDIMLSRTVEQKQLANGMDYPFKVMADFLRSGDFAFGNVETSITPGAVVQSGQMLFRASPESAAELKKAGFAIVSLANNHAMNYLQAGLLDTLKYLKEAGVAYSGAGVDAEEAHAPTFVTANGVTFAFLSYTDPNVWGGTPAGENTPGLAVMDTEKMVAAVKDAKTKADYVIVSMHSGTEYTLNQTELQKSFAHAAIDAGAEMVIGHHPHWVQPVEVYNGKYIFYSLGNFIFDQMWSRETMEGLGVRLTFQNGLKRIEPVPVLIEDYAQPRPLTGAEADKVYEEASIEPGARQGYKWDGGSSTYVAVDVPAIVTKLDSGDVRIKKTEEADLDKNSTNESYQLQNGTLTIKEGDKTLWTSDENWWVDDFALADANGDGADELNMSIWKPGDFGSSKPFWVKENDMSVKNHFAVYEPKDGTYGAVWMSSNLDAPNCEFTFGDVNEDDKQELVVIEGDYGDFPACSGKNVAVWSWNDWGFSNDWRSEASVYQNLDVTWADGSVIAVDRGQ